jgi:hypothetical protein
MDELEDYLRRYADSRSHFVVDARSASRRPPVVANLVFDDLSFSARLPPELYLQIRPRDLPVDEAALLALGWVRREHADPTALGFRRLLDDAPPSRDPAALAAEAYAVAASLVGGDVSLSLKMPSASERRQAKIDAAGEDVSFLLAWFWWVMPVSALLTALLAAASGLVAPLEAAVFVVITAAAFAFVMVAERTSPVGRSLVVTVANRVGTLLQEGLIGGTGKVVHRLAPIPIVGTLAKALGMTLVFWLPVGILALVASLL